MGGYLLIAMGLINLRYQSGHIGVLTHSLIIIIPGALLLATTWVPALAKKLESKAIQAVCITLGLMLIVYGVIN